MLFAVFACATQVQNSKDRLVDGKKVIVVSRLFMSFPLKCTLKVGLGVTSEKISEISSQRDFQSWTYCTMKKSWSVFACLVSIVFQSQSNCYQVRTFGIDLSSILLMTFNRNWNLIVKY